MMAFGWETVRRRIELVRSGRAPFRDVAPGGLHLRLIALPGQAAGAVESGGQVLVPHKGEDVIAGKAPFRDTAAESRTGRDARRLLRMGWCVAYQDNALRPELLVPHKGEDVIAGKAALHAVLPAGRAAQPHGIAPAGDLPGGGRHLRRLPGQAGEARLALLERRGL